MTPPTLIRRTHARWRLAISLVAIGTAAAASAPGSALGANANFLGTWDLSNGQQFTVTSQQPSGACAGTSSLGGFTVSNCQVTGSRGSWLPPASNGQSIALTGRYLNHETARRRPTRIRTPLTGAST